MTNSTKHAPATPLPWKQGKWVTAGIHEEYVYCVIGNEKTACSLSVHGRLLKSGKVTSVRQNDGSYKNKLPERDADTDAQYVVHAVNAYPKIVAALLRASTTNTEGAKEARALLRELGELE